DALAHAAGADDPRAAAVAALSEALVAGRANALSRLKAGSLNGRKVAGDIAAATDLVVRGALDFVVSHHLPNPGAPEVISVIALGGYGRGEMAPFSDVDLLFLTEAQHTNWVEQVIENVLYILWDLKLKVGQSVRTIADSLVLAREDFTIRTSLLETRWLWGDRALFIQLRDKLRSDLFKGTEEEFVEAKLAERDARHSRHGGSRYLVEPNIKEAKGGLRDLQTLFWLAKYIYNAEETSDLIKRGVLSAEEADVFAEADRFLWTVRCHLHDAAGRGQEQLTFDFQVEIAERMGFEPQDGRRAVEVFMQTYFRRAKEVGELTRFFCAALEADQKKQRPTIAQRVRALTFGAARAVPDGFFIRDGRIDIGTESFLLDDPVNLLRSFEEGLRTGALIHPNAFRMIVRNAHLARKLRDDPEANRLFMWMLVESDNPERALRRMNETGVLSEFIPEFDAINAMMQFNMYHHYTVDEHTIHAIDGLKQLVDGKLQDSLPLASKIVSDGVDLGVLSLAVFFHDIGKGRPEPHEIVGAEIAARVCPRLGLDEARTEMVVWLVRHHLIMSDVAQKRDITDPATVRDFANQIRSAQRLKLLVVLTALDIRAVGPGVWNNWKAQLLRSLYYDALAMLDVGVEHFSRTDRIDAAKDLLRERLDDWAEDDVESWLSRHYQTYWLGLEIEEHEVFARMAKMSKADQISSRFSQDKARDATRCCFYLVDHPGVFSRMAGALALSGASVVEARNFTDSEGMSSTIFWIQDADGHPIEEARHDRLKKSIHRSLRGDIIARDALKPKRRTKKRERPFDVPTTITFDNAGSELYTVIEVDTRDRVGLLYDLTRTLSAANINIFSAVVTTYGEQAVDSFYVKDLFGFKIASKSKQETIEKKLREAISRAREEALEGT
ncbi:MAG: [protein-PII] uridylyltransferase, partial [Pikeienuella sp.]